MTTDYKVLSLTDESAKHLTADWLGGDEDDYEDSYHCGVFRLEDDVPVELLGTDGGEPEDQTLNRDWSWVVGALREAYRLGVSEKHRD